MLDVGQPGELPLMRELSALRRNRGLRDPSTTSSWKSPVLEAISSNLPVDSLEDDEGGMSDDLKGDSTMDGSGRRDSRRGTIKRGPFKSPQVSDVDPRLSWDLGIEALSEVSTRDRAAIGWQQRENHLDELEVSTERRRQLGSKSILHNWKTANCIADLGTPESVSGESTRQGDEDASDILQQHRQSVRDALRGEGRFVPLQNDAARFKASQKTARITTGAQALSPLVLSSHDDIHKFSQKQSLFSLEVPYDDEEEYLEEEGHDGSNSLHSEVSAFKVGGSRSQSPLVSNEARRSTRKPPHPAYTRSWQAITSPVSNGTHWTRSGRSVPWEAELLEKEPELPYHRSKNQKHAQSQAAMQERTLPPVSKKALRRKGGSVAESQSVLQQRFTSNSFSTRSSAPPRSPGIEPLPFLTELEDDSGSDEFTGSSVEGDCGRLSTTSELHGELELKAFNASDRHHAGRSVDVAEKETLQLAVPESRELVLCEDRARNLSQKYRPRGFEEVVGQNIVTQALSNAILRGKIAPVYLFQGSRGTGKTSAARIFAAALICISSEEQRPCGDCRECISVAMGKCSEVKEVDAASNNGIERVKVLLEETISAPSLSRYKVFIVDECHVLTTETWNALLKILEEPPMNVVFILITTDPDQLPRTVVSRCQKFPFPKIKDAEIVKRLQRLAGLENLEIDNETLHVIASRSDGSLRDAETTLDQLSLLGQKINSSTVFELVGSASDERLLSLLDSALVADTINTVRRARELVDSGVEPLSLMSRLATLITDLLAGSYKFTEKERKGFFRKQNLSEERLERLRMAMKTLSEAEKQLRVSNDRTTWLTAALLQLGPDRSFLFPASCAGTSLTQSPVALDVVGENDVVDTEQSANRQTWIDDANFYQKANSEHLPTTVSEVNINEYNNPSLSMKPSPQGTHWSLKRSNEIPSVKLQVKVHSPGNSLIHNKALQEEPIQVVGHPQDCEAPSTNSMDIVHHSKKEQLLSPRKLDDIWSRVVERCRPLPLKQLLNSDGRLLSISLSEVDAVVHLEFYHPEHKSRCERSHESIASVFEGVLGFPVEIKASLASLPAEEREATGTWISAERSGSCVSSNNSRIQSQDVTVRGPYSKSWKAQGGATTNATECFPAIPQVPFASAPNETQTFEAAATSNWNRSYMPSSDTSARPVRLADSSSTIEERLESAWVDEARRFSPDSADAIELRSELLHQGGPRNQRLISLQDSYLQDLESDGMNVVVSREGRREIVRHDHISSEIRLSDELDDTQPRHSCMERRLDAQAYYSVDVPRSSDADLQKRKGGALKMVRRLTMRSRIRSLPSSDQNSPDERGSSLRVPRFLMKSHTNSPKSQDSKLQIDTPDASEQVVDSMETGSPVAVPHRRSLLKGAAGTFARLFQGKQTKQSSDATSK